MSKQYIASVVKNKMAEIQQVDDEGNPDWQFMEDYIKSLPFSSSI